MTARPGSSVLLGTKSMSPLLGYAAKVPLSKSASLDLPEDDLENTELRFKHRCKCSFALPRRAGLNLPRCWSFRIHTHGRGGQGGQLENRAERISTHWTRVLVSPRRFFGLVVECVCSVTGIACYHGLMNVEDDLPDNDDRPDSVFLITAAGILFSASETVRLPDSAHRRRGARLLWRAQTTRRATISFEHKLGKRPVHSLSSIK